MREVVIVEAVRTPIGRRNGKLKDTHPVVLASLVLKEIVGRAGIKPELVEDVVFGCVSQVGEQSLNVARENGRGGTISSRSPDPFRHDQARMLQPAQLATDRTRIVSDPTCELTNMHSARWRFEEMSKNRLPYHRCAEERGPC